EGHHATRDRNSGDWFDERDRIACDDDKWAEERDRANQDGCVAACELDSGCVRGSATLQSRREVSAESVTRANSRANDQDRRQHHADDAAGVHQYDGKRECRGYKRWWPELATGRS